MQNLDLAIELAGKSRVDSPPPFIVGLGGTLSAGSSTERAIEVALAAAREAGAETAMLDGPSLELPIYAWERKERTDDALNMVRMLRKADGIIIGSPGYHGSISGLIKNALDYVQDMAGDDWPYFHGRPVGAIATGAGWQGAVTTLIALRQIVHALRGWNTPLGVAINTSTRMFDSEGACLDEKIDAMLRSLGKEVADAARVRALMESPANPEAAGRPEA